MKKKREEGVLDRDCRLLTRVLKINETKKTYPCTLYAPGEAAAADAACLAATGAGFSAPDRGSSCMAIDAILPSPL